MVDPELDDVYSWLLKMLTWRTFVTVVLSCVSVVEPSVVNPTPGVPAPPTQILVPSVVTADRGLLPLAKLVNDVEVSREPVPTFRMATARGTAVAVVPGSDGAVPPPA